MRTSQKGIELIKGFEGFSCSQYICPAGYPTIGYGHVVRVGEIFPEKISSFQGEEILRADLLISENAVKKLIRGPLSQNQFDALVSFTYNLGAGALQRSGLRQKVNRGEHALAAAEFSRWIYSGGAPLKGLVARRSKEAEIYLSA